MKSIIMIGYFEEAIELCESAGYTIEGVVNENDPKCEYKYLGNDQFVLNNAIDYSNVPICIVPDNPSVRQALYDCYKEKGFSVETIISPKAFVSNSAFIGEGCMIQRGCNISSNVVLGKCVRINTLANVMHDSRVDNFSTIAPNAVVLGNCRIGEKCYVGANSTILPGLSILGESIVGAGAVVTKNISEKVTVVGVPAHKL